MKKKAVKIICTVAGSMLALGLVLTVIGGMLTNWVIFRKGISISPWGVHIGAVSWENGRVLRNNAWSAEDVAITNEETATDFAVEMDTIEDNIDQWADDLDSDIDQWANNFESNMEFYFENMGENITNSILHSTEVSNDFFQQFLKQYNTYGNSQANQIESAIKNTSGKLYDGEMESYFSTFQQDIENIEIQIDQNIAFVLQTGNELSLTGKNIPAESSSWLSVAIKENHLKIHFGDEADGKHTSARKTNWRFRKGQTPEIVLTLPTDLNAGMLSINAQGVVEVDCSDMAPWKSLFIEGGVGITKLNNITAEVCEVNTGSGAAIIQNSNFSLLNLSVGSGIHNLNNVYTEEETNLSVNSGLLTVTNSEMANVHGDLGSGIISYSGDMLGESTWQVGSGIMTIQLPGSENQYKIINSSKGKNVWINESKVAEIGNSSADRIIALECGSGNIHVVTGEYN